MRRSPPVLLSFGLRVSAAALWFLIAMPSWAAPESVPADWQQDYDQGVEAYRNGQFEKAYKQFKQLTNNVPQCIECHYYFGIASAQMSRFKDARQAYNAVLQLDPNGEAGQLAKEGLSYLPDPGKLDPPPKLQAQATATAPASAAQPAQASSNPTVQAANAMAGGMDAQTMQMMMMMSSMGGGGNNSGMGGFNPMMIPLLQKMQNSNNPNDSENQMAPEVMSNMLMNQMMSNFNLFNNNNNDNNN